MSKKIKYEIDLPVFRCGDDMNYWLMEMNDDFPAAMKKMASQYNKASEICSKIASAVFENPEIELEKSNAYEIVIRANSKDVTGLLSDGLIFDAEWPEPVFAIEE